MIIAGLKLTLSGQNTSCVYVFLVSAFHVHTDHVMLVQLFYTTYFTFDIRIDWLAMVKIQILHALYMNPCRKKKSKI